MERNKFQRKGYVNAYGFDEDGVVPMCMLGFTLLFGGIIGLLQYHENYERKIQNDPVYRQQVLDERAAEERERSEIFERPFKEHWVYPVR